MRTVVTALVLGVLLGPAGAAVSFEAGASEQAKAPSESVSRQPSRWWTSEQYRQELKLTAEQSAEIERIVQASMTRLRADKEDLDRAQTDFRQLMKQPTATEREMLKAAERLEMARYSISRERTTMLVRIHNVLTPDQRRGLDAIAKRHGERAR